MANNLDIRNYIAYYRVSTAKQGNSGLGLEAQKEAVKQFLIGRAGELTGEFQEVETGKGVDALAKRSELCRALDACKRTGATLLIAKLDRLARNVHFVSGLMESKVKFVACDMPEATELTIHIMAAFAEHEAKRISQRTMDALAIAKSRGVNLGIAGPANLVANIHARRQAALEFAEKLRPVLEGFTAKRMPQRKMVYSLNELGIPTIRGGQWSLVQIQRILNRLSNSKPS